MKINFTDYDIYLFREGKHTNCYEFMGSHFSNEGGKDGVSFTLWCPGAREVYVVGDFNNWDGDQYRMEKVKDSGIWNIFIEGLKSLDLYKYNVIQNNGQAVLKSDPYGFFHENRPNTATRIYEFENFNWSDEEYTLSKKKTKNSPVNIYEVHLGSWRRGEGNRFLTYKEIAQTLPSYVKEMGFTHVEIMPITEHPLDDSWGYLSIGYYSPTARYGTPNEFKYLINAFHELGIGVILDWVPGHFCKDSHGLYKFDGSYLYEYENEIKRENKAWGAANFDLGKNEVRSFLFSNAMYYIKEFHIDGFRIDAVSNMIYLNYGNQYDEIITNCNGGHENLEAIDFLQELSQIILKEDDKFILIAEEATAFPLITKPPSLGGVGFNYKWNMGWMNDILKYVELDPVYRKYNHNLITFSMMYAYSENFILPMSHDEVVHGKKSLINKMWGDYWTKFSGLRCFLTYMMLHPGKKSFFMGYEIAQFIEWKFNEELEWELLSYKAHEKFHGFIKYLNHFYLKETSLWQRDFSYDGFKWIDPDNSSQSIASFIRFGEDEDDIIIAVINFTPVVYYDFRIGVPFEGVYEEVLNTDSLEFGGSGQIMDGDIFSEKKICHGREDSLLIKVPPMATLLLKLKNNNIKE